MDYVRTIESEEELSSHEDGFAAVLSRAFYNDPYYLWIMPNDERRMAQLHWWMKILLRYTFIYGSIHHTEDHKGIAMWVGPDEPVLHDVKILSMGVIMYPFKIGVRNFLRVLDISGQWNKEHKKLAKQHYYLMVIGVEPEFQGKGIGSRLMRVGLDRADDAGLECYLETVTEEDVAFYRKRDFDIIVNRGFGVNSEYWLMTRAPLK
jgi:ribosomal protein S18 acetylase RimI-like enzyme